MKPTGVVRQSVNAIVNQRRVRCSETGARCDALFADGYFGSSYALPSATANVQGGSK